MSTKREQRVESEATVTKRRAIPIHDETAPIACTIGDDEVPERLALFERMRAALERLEHTEHGLLLHFPQRLDIEDDLRRFAIDEKRCCQFWGFEVLTEPSLSLRWDAPASARHLLDRLAAFFTGDEPATTLRGLL